MGELPLQSNEKYSQTVSLEGIGNVDIYRLISFTENLATENLNIENMDTALAEPFLDSPYWNGLTPREIIDEYQKNF